MENSAFIELLQISIGSRNRLTRVPTIKDWMQIFQCAQQQAIEGVMMEGLEKLPREQLPPKSILLQWIGLMEIIQMQGRKMNEECLNLEKMFSTAGFKTCILKGQGNALLYPNPLARHCGDIDIWVMPNVGWGVRKTVDYLVSKCGMDKLHVVYHHSEFPILNDVEVEVHWRPSWRSNPVYNSRMQKWFKKMAEMQFNNVDETSGMHVPTLDFNVVYLLQHMFLHVMQEGLGLRQVVDYYYLLRKVYTSRLMNQENKEKLLKVIKYLGLYEFAGAMMYVLQEALALEGKYLIVPVDKQRGNFLLKEILLAGNFGKFDVRNESLYKQRGTVRSLYQLKRKFRFVKDYPAEVLSGVFQVYHVIWRNLKLWKWE